MSVAETGYPAEQPKPDAERRRAPVIDAERAQDRVSSYVYGNIILLALLIAEAPATVSHGTAAILVLVTAATTFLAHTVSHVFAHRINHPDGELGDSALAVLRDSVPIVTAGLISAAILAVGWLTRIDAGIALSVASAVLIVRLGLSGPVAQRISGQRASLLGFWSGLVLAFVAVIIVVIKVALTH